MDLLRRTIYWMARLIELALVGLGLYVVLGPDRNRLAILGLWDVLAIVYLAAGFLVLRRSRLDVTPRRRPAVPSVLPGLRPDFLFAATASAVGVLAAVLTILIRHDQDVQLVGGVAMISSWLLLHVGYSGMYAEVDEQHGGLAFPGDAAPGRVDYLYFSFSIGATFAASDVSVTTRRMRWQVMVHSVVSFFYNAAVIAIAIGLLKP
ncbi:DUF1345 domain-containing protein [Nonomuraea sp. NPDC050328]|uniref:DUF1345 domain-containing protein n=1 Tax=Nonomuraea sp. NPDC050328 TaxID=3364361 RepID=UPI0037A600FA